MKVVELREELKKYKEVDKDKIIIELYKRIPKKVKEEYDIDGFIKDVNAKKETKEEAKDIETLVKEVDYFLECAREGLYASPNRIIPKNERSKWRFKAKKFYKELNSYKPHTKEGILATYYLIELFKVLSYGSCSLTFSNWETFKAIQVSQADYFDLIIKRKLTNNFSKDNLKDIIKLLRLEKDPYELSSAMFDTFIYNLNTIDIKNIAIELLDKEVSNCKEEIIKLNKERKETFYEKELCNDFIECILKIYLSLYEVDTGIKYYHKNYIEKDTEVKEYILLEILKDNELYNDWIKEYESKLNEIDYRYSLKKDYIEIKNKCKLTNIK